jgi:uncharacterized membrane protein YkoI
MKKIFCLLLATSLLSFVAVTATAADKKEEKSAPKGSIHPTGDPKAAELVALAKISFCDALKTALATVPGGVTKADLEVEDGCLMYSFEIVGADKKSKEVEIDAGNGNVLATEDMENEKEDKKD